MNEEQRAAEQQDLIEQLATIAHTSAPDQVESLLFQSGMADLAVSLRLDRQLRSAQS
jgi:hypothetical protein